jgi:hypothetical protein
LEEKVAEEKLQMKSIDKWADRLENALFSYAGGEDLQRQYETADTLDEQRQYLTSVIACIFAGGPEKNGGEANHRKLMDDVIDGHPIDPNNDQYVRNGVQDMLNLWETGNSTEMKERFVDLIQQLSERAAEEEMLTTKSIMVGRLVSNVLQVSQAFGIDLGLDMEQMAAATGAIEMANVAKMYHDARHYLVENPDKWHTEQGEEAIRDLMEGTAIKSLLKNDRKRLPEGITNIQKLMGHGELSLNTLDGVMQNERLGLRVPDETVKQILKHPHSLKSARVAEPITTAFYRSIDPEGALNEGNERVAQMRQQRNQQIDQQVNPLEQQAHVNQMM